MLLDTAELKTLETASLPFKYKDQSLIVPFVITLTEVSTVFIGIETLENLSPNRKQKMFEDPESRIKSVLSNIIVSNKRKEFINNSFIEMSERLSKVLATQKAFEEQLKI